VFCESHIDLPCKATAKISLQRKRGKRRFNDKGIEFGSSMTRTCQFPSHGLFVHGIDVEIESQVGDGTFGEMEIESKADYAFMGIYAQIEAFEFLDRGFDEFSMGIGSADARILAAVMRCGLLSDQFTLDFGVLHGGHEPFQANVIDLATWISKYQKSCFWVCRRKKDRRADLDGKLDIATIINHVIKSLLHIRAK